MKFESKFEFSIMKWRAFKMFALDPKLSIDFRDPFDRLLSEEKYTFQLKCTLITSFHFLNDVFLSLELLMFTLSSI